MFGVRKHSYKHLDEKTVNGFNNAVIELNMRDLAEMVYNSNHGIHRFISEYEDIVVKNGFSKVNDEFVESLIAAIETKY